MDLDLATLVITTLREIQDERNYSLRGMALKLRISAGHLSMVYSGQRSAGISFFLAALREFPKIRQVVANALVLPSSSKSEPSQKPNEKGPPL